MGKDVDKCGGDVDTLREEVDKNENVVDIVNGGLQEEAILYFKSEDVDIG